VHEVIYQTATPAVAAVADLVEPDQPEGDILKRLVKIIYKAASDPGLLQMPWEQICRELVERTMSSWGPGNSDAPWFYTINLTPVFSSAAWELMQAAGVPPVSLPEVEETVNLEYEDKLDRLLLDTAIWQVVQNIFEDKKVQKMVYQALSRAYWPALDETLGHLLMQERQAGGILPPDKELQHLEAFTKRWLDDAIGRAWNSVEHHSGVALDGETIMELFRALIVPFGEHDPFTCLPGVMMEQIGRPPPHWPYIQQAVKEYFEEWEKQQRGSKKRRKGNAGAGTGAGEGREEARAEAAAARSPLPAAEAQAPPQRWQRQRYMPGQAGPMAGASFRGFVAEAEVDGKDEGQEEPQERQDESQEEQDEPREEQDGPREEQDEPLEEQDEPQEEQDEPQDMEAETEAAEAAEECNVRHPRCTSEEDCIGTPSNRLVQHLFNGQPGDIYCEPCWDAFCVHTPSLDGTIVDE